MLALTNGSRIALIVMVVFFTIIVISSIWSAIRDFQIKRSRYDNFVSLAAVKKANVVDDDGNGMPL